MTGEATGTSRVALVTGASGAIGRAVVDRLRRDGWRVIESSRRAGSGLLAADLRVPEEAERLVGQALREAGRLDLVVHAAARDLRGAVDVQPVDDWWSVVETQLTGAFHVLHAAIPHLESSGGAIVLVACEWGVVGRAGASAVSAAASGLMGLTKALAREYGPRVRTNCVAPGELAGTSVDQAAYPGVPVDRIARPDADSVAAAVTFLAGPDGRAFNGQVLHPNGGATLA